MYDKRDVYEEIPKSGSHYHLCDCGWSGVILFRMGVDYWFRCPNCGKLYFIPYKTEES